MTIDWNTIKLKYPKCFDKLVEIGTYRENECHGYICTDDQDAFDKIWEILENEL